MTVLVLAAHPDDELLGPGGTIARHVHEGEEVHAVVLAEGATSRYEDGMASVLAESSKRAAEVLGLTSLTLGTLPDQRLDALPLIEVTQQIEAIVDQLRPTVVYSHFPGDVNTDHGVVARAAWTACRPYVLPKLTRFAVFETPSSTEWAWPLEGSVFKPNLFVDIESTLDQKLQAMACYSSELRDYPHPRSLRAIKERAAFWGSCMGRKAIEAFQVLREMR
jgi:LmbE family N-acetylglucosaminyl deacetylase